MATQNFSGYPSYPTGGQEQNYSAGAGGKLSTSQYRPTSTLKPVTSSDTLTKTAGAPVPGTTVAKPASTQQPVLKAAPVNVTTQAPSPAITQAQQPVLSNFQRMAQAAQRLTGTTQKLAAAAPAPKVPAWMEPYQRLISGNKPAPYTPPDMTPAPKPPTATPPIAVDPGNAGPPAPPPTPAGPGQGGGPIGMGNLGALIEQMLGAPSQYADEGYKKTYESLTGQLHDDISADAASRGLDYTSVPTDIYGREAGKIATNLSADAARSYHDNLKDALGLASGFGQQAFDNGVTSQQQQLQIIQMLMGLGNYAENPLGGAVDAGFDWAGAMGQQGAGSADISGYLSSLIPFLGGGGGAPAGGGTPPFNPDPAHFPGWNGQL